MAQLRFLIRDPYEGSTELRISAASTSLGRDVPVYQGWYSHDADAWRLQALVRLEHPISGKPNPTVYFSVSPKF
jgi:glutamine synthetase adenylyltransferase